MSGYTDGVRQKVVDLLVRDHLSVYKVQAHLKEDFLLDVSIPKNRLQRTFSFSGIQPTSPFRKSEITLFVEEANFDFDVEISQIALRDADGTPCSMAWENEAASVFRFRRTDTGNK